MPKQPPSSLYNHKSRNATARQLNLSTNPSGRSSYSYTSSQLPVPPVAPEPHLGHEHYMEDFNMDVDGTEHAFDDNLNNIDEDVPDEGIQVGPGVRVHIPKPKAKRYANSVGI
jgi:hypothetical protein